MRTLRQIHLYLGCLFAPLILYFSLSGAWQVFRFNDVLKDEAPSVLRSAFHELSKPHTSSTLPGANPKTDASTSFKVVATAMSLGLFATTAIGLIIAWKSSRSTRTTLICVVLGAALPAVLLLLR